MEESITAAYDKQVALLDFSDELPSGFRFTPTDSELIVDYLKAKIESRDAPKCRLHEVNIYNHSPEELTEGYRSHDDVWYFLTPRDRKYPKGNRPDRAVGQFGFWRASTKHKEVYDAKTGKMVGYKRALAFHTKINKEKTKWLMHEYTTEKPNLPFGKNTNNKLNDWVLSKIYYKKEKEQTTDDNSTNPINKVKKVIQEPNRTRLPKRRRVSAENREIVPQQETNPHLDLDTNAHPHVQMEPTHTTPRVNYQGHVSSPYPIINPMQPMTAFQSSIQQPQSQYCYDQNQQFTSNACQISEPPANSSPRPLDDYTTPAATEHGLNPIQPVVLRQTEFDDHDQNYMFSSTNSDIDEDGYIIPDSSMVQSWYDTLQDVQKGWDQSNNNININGDTQMNYSSPYPIINPMQPMTAFQGNWSSIQPPQCFDQNQFTSNASNPCQISIEPPANSSPQPLDDIDEGAYTTPTTDIQPDVPLQTESCYDELENMFSDISAFDYSSSMEALDMLGDISVSMLQNLYDDAPTTLQDVQKDVSDQSNNIDASASAYDATISSADPPVVEEVEWSLDIVEQHCAD